MGMEKLPPVTGLPSLEDIQSSAQMMMASRDDLSPAAQAGLLIRALAIHMRRIEGQQIAVAGELEKIKAHLQLQ